MFNFYGPTEASIDVCYHECSIDETGDCTPIGVAFDNTDLYILNDDLSPVQNGEVGELYAGGIGLSAGYLGMPKLTKDKFIHTIIN